MTKRQSKQSLPAKQKVANQVTIQETPKIKSTFSGSVSEEFTEALQQQAFLAAPRLHGADSETIEKHKKATKAVMCGVNPQDEMEGMLAAQMLAVHNAAMECFSYAAVIGSSSPERKGDYLNQANKLCRTYAGAIESLTKYRNKDILEQKLVVERVHVHDGGKAIVGKCYLNKRREPD